MEVLFRYSLSNIRAPEPIKKGKFEYNIFCSTSAIDPIADFINKSQELKGIFQDVLVLHSFLFSDNNFFFSQNSNP